MNIIDWFKGLFKGRDEKAKELKKYRVEVSLSSEAELRSFGSGGLDKGFMEFFQNEMTEYDEKRHVFQTVCKLDIERNRCVIGVWLIERGEFVLVDDDGIGVTVEEYQKNEISNKLVVSKAEKVMPRMFKSLCWMLELYKTRCDNSLKHMRVELVELEHDIKDTGDESVRLGDILKTVEDLR